MIPALVVAVFVVVQSLFGVGLLVFGTPTLLLLGYPFAQVLSILLPASIAVSLLQVYRGSLPAPAFARTFVAWCLCPLAAALAFVLWFGFSAGFLNVVIAVVLALFALLRVRPELGTAAASWVKGHQRFWLVLMGATHGLSNLGGGLLLIFAASTTRDKRELRSLIAFCYACFAGVQLAVLAIASPSLFGPAQLAYVGIALGGFVMVGQPVFEGLPALAFDRLLTALVAAYAVLLALKSAGIV